MKTQRVKRTKRVKRIKRTKRVKGVTKDRKKNMRSKRVNRSSKKNKRTKKIRKKRMRSNNLKGGRDPTENAGEVERLITRNAELSTQLTECIRNSPRQGSYGSPASGPSSEWVGGGRAYSPRPQKPMSLELEGIGWKSPHGLFNTLPKKKEGSVNIQYEGTGGFNNVWLTLQPGKPILTVKAEQSGEPIVAINPTRITVSVPKKKRKGYEFIICLDVVGPETEQKKYIVSLKTLEDKEEWTKALNEYGRYVDKIQYQ